MSDRTDDLIEALVKARELGFSRAACIGIVRDVYDAPWEVTAPSVRIHAVASSYVAARAVTAEEDFGS